MCEMRDFAGKVVAGRRWSRSRCRSRLGQCLMERAAPSAISTGTAAWRPSCRSAANFSVRRGGSPCTTSSHRAAQMGIPHRRHPLPGGGQSISTATARRRSSSAPGPPITATACNGTNDDTSYVGVLDSAGRAALAQREPAGFIREIFNSQSADLDRDGKMEIVSARACHRQVDPDRGEVKVLRADSGKVQRHYLQTSDLLSQAVRRRYPTTHPGLEIVMRRLLGRAGDTGREAASARARSTSARRSRSSGCAPSARPRRTADRGRGRPRGLQAVRRLPEHGPRATRQKLDANIGLSVLPVRQGKSRHLLLEIDQLYLISLNPATHGISWRAAGLFSRFSLVLAWIVAFNALFFLCWRAKIEEAGRGDKRRQGGFRLAHGDPGDGAPHENADDQHPLGGGAAQNRAGERQGPRRRCLRRSKRPRTR